MDATRCAWSSAHRVTTTGGAATGELESGTPPCEAKRQVIAPRPTECATSALSGAAGNAHREDAVTMAALRAGDVVVGQRGDSLPDTPAENLDGINGEAKTMPIIAIVAGVLWWADGWRAVTGLSLVTAAVLSLWLVRQLGQWHEPEGDQFVPVAAIQGARAGLNKRRMATKRRIKQNWTRVFDIMVERGMAGELAQCRLVNKQLQSQLTEAQEFVTKTLLYRQNKENDRIQSLQDHVERLMAEKKQLELALEQQVENFKAEAQKTLAEEDRKLVQENGALQRENQRLVEQMHGLGQATTEADDARLVAEQMLKDAEVKFAGQLEKLKQQVRALKVAEKASSSVPATVVHTKPTLREQIKRLVGPL